MIWSISLLLLSWNVNPFFCVTLDSPTKNPLRPWWSLSQLSAAGSYDSTTFNTVPCPSLPTASLEPKDLLTRLNQSWSDADLQVRAALKNDKSPGGAVLCVVYRGTVLWTAGYGLKNMSGKKTPFLSHTRKEKKSGLLFMTCHDFLANQIIGWSTILC